MPFFLTLEATPKCCQLQISFVNHLMSRCQWSDVAYFLELGKSLTDGMLHDALLIRILHVPAECFLL